eukprot:1161795-Pelagomonas_calceolata.AAC.4
MDDFNPNFSFSFGSEPGTASKPQAAWEFAGALKQAKAEQNRTNAHSTSLDQKIKRRLQTNADMKGWVSASREDDGLKQLLSPVSHETVSCKPKSLPAKNKGRHASMCVQAQADSVVHNNAQFMRNEGQMPTVARTHTCAHPQKAEDKQKKREQRKASKRGGSNNASGAKESSEEDSDDEDDDDSDEPLPGDCMD